MLLTVGLGVISMGILLGFLIKKVKEIKENIAVFNVLRGADEHRSSISERSMAYMQKRTQAITERNSQQIRLLNDSVLKGVRFNIDCTNRLCNYLELLEAHSMVDDEVPSAHTAMLHEIHEQLNEMKEIMEDTHFAQTGRYHTHGYLISKQNPFNN